MKWHKNLNLDFGDYQFHNHANLAHYANAACDIEFKFPIGFKELEGIHSRTNYDLCQHQKFSKKKLSYFDSEINDSYIPYVVETSVGLDRLFLSILCGSFLEEKVKDEQRVVLKLPPHLAPISVAILPLLKKDGLNDKARNIFNDLKSKFSCHYEEKDSIGKRYRRQDAIGTPLCVTIDHDTIKDDKVTLRSRDTMAQERISIMELSNIIKEKLDI
jgi:glycyl-tRNA synthetase